MALSLAILLLSASVLSFEIIVIRLLAIHYWQPFVTLAISTALLGYGLSGSILVRVRTSVFPNRHIAFPSLALAATMLYRPVIWASGQLQLDPGLIIRDPSQWFKVGILVSVLTLPFTLASGALALPLLERESVGRYYGWNFLGAGLGVLIVLTTLGTLDPRNLPLVPIILGGFATLSSMIHFHRKRKGLVLSSAAMACLAVFYPSAPIEYGPYKDISYAFLLPSAREEANRSGITGKFQVVTAPSLHSASGLSTRYRGEIPRQAGIYRDGDRIGTLLLTEGPMDTGLDFLKWQTAAAPFTLPGRRGRSAIIGFDGGEEAARALLYGWEPPVIIEPDEAIKVLVRDNPQLFRPWIFGPGRTVLVSESARNYLSNRSAGHDLIVYTPRVNLAATAAGLTGTEENYEVTVQGMEAALGSLSEEGIIALTGWNQFPSTGRWKLLSLFRQIKVLNDDGQFKGRIYLVTGWSNHTFLVKATPFDPAEVLILSAFCTKRGFTLIDGDYFPEPGESARGGEYAWVDDLDLRPPYDSRPYPWHSLKLSYMKHLSGETREAAFSRVEWGFFFLLMVLFFTTVFAFAALALSRPDRKTGGGVFFNLYFACLGTGYMTLEILLIKRAGLVMGPPAISAAIVLASFLSGSGLGSHTAGRLMARKRPVLMIFPVIIILSGSIYFLIPFLAALPAVARMPALFILTLPPAFVMGFPFPCALMNFEKERESLVPWAFALNGYTSVIGSSLAGVLAVIMGFGSLLLLGALCYMTAGWIWWKGKISPESNVLSPEGKIRDS